MKSTLLIETLFNPLSEVWAPSSVAGVADKLNPGIVCLRTSDQKLVPPRVTRFFNKF